MVLYINKIGPRHANNMDNIRLLSIHGVVDRYYSSVIFITAYSLYYSNTVNGLEVL